MTVNNGSYTDPTATWAPATVTTRDRPPAPSVEVNIVDDLLSVGETSEVTFSFSEKVTGFDEGSLTVVGGTVTKSQEHRRRSDRDRYLHPDPGLYRLRQRDREQRQLPDLNGNVGTGNSDDTAIDTQAPSVEVNIVDDLLSVGETRGGTSASVKKPTGFDEGSLTVVGAPSPISRAPTVVRPGPSLSPRPRAKNRLRHP
ncbi:Ig-like domain-containing protein [Aeromonas veronii]|nr:Ig-like domain-containing protein [Aeromonas veronii]